MPQHLFRELPHVIPAVRNVNGEIMAETFAEGIAGGDFVRVDSGGDVGHAENIAGNCDLSNDFSRGTVFSAGREDGSSHP